MKRKTVIIIAGLALAVSAAAYMATRPEKAAWTTPVRQDYVQSLLASGEIAADESLTVISEAAGKLTKVSFEEGGQVEASKIMAELDSQELQKSINEKTAALSAAQSNYNAVVTTNYQVAVQEASKLRKELDIQKRDYEKNLALFEAGAIPDAELQKLRDSISKLETDLKASEIRMNSYAPGGSEAARQSALVAQARTNLESSRSDARKYSIKAPFSGVVVQKFVSEGQVIQSGAAIAEIAKSGKKYAEIKIDEKNAVYVKPGQPAYVYPSSNPDRKIKSQVSWISPVVDRASGTILVKIEIPESAKSDFLLSMTVTAELVTAEFPQALVVDATYVAREGQSGHVFVLDNGRAKQVYVKVTGDGAFVMIETVSGLQAAAGESQPDGEAPALSEESILLHPEKLSDGNRVEKQENGGN